MLVERIKQVPEYLMRAALADVRRIDWKNPPQDSTRKKSAVFSTSTSIPLRIHDVPDGEFTVLEYGEFVECRDTGLRKLYPSLNLLVNWMYKTVNGLHLGRIQLVRLEGGGDVGLHIDPGTYFEVHDRMHVPLITDEGTVFFSPDEEARMPVGVLCRLNNRGLHGVRNESIAPRVHLIVDIQTKDHPWKSA
jgi:hypothetical protein